MVIIDNCRFCAGVFGEDTLSWAKSYIVFGVRNILVRGLQFVLDVYKMTQ